MVSLLAWVHTPTPKVIRLVVLRTLSVRQSEAFLISDLGCTATSTNASQLCLGCCTCKYMYIGRSFLRALLPIQYLNVARMAAIEVKFHFLWWLWGYEIVSSMASCHMRLPLRQHVYEHLVLQRRLRRILLFSLAALTVSQVLPKKHWSVRRHHVFWSFIV